MKHLYQTVDGKIFHSEGEAQDHEDNVLQSAFIESGVSDFLDNLDDDDMDEWYSTDRKLATHFLERLLVWCRENNKTLTVVDN